MPKINDIINAIEIVAPRYLQEDYDNAGLQIGDISIEANAALLCIDVTEDIIDEAISKNCNLVISHHPLLFKGIKSITLSDATGRIINKAIKNDIAIYSAHTNLDNAWGGVSHDIAHRIGLSDIEVLEPQSGDLLKLVVFVPLSHCEKVRNALFEAGAGRYGNYDCCSYSIDGKGSFRPLDGANPFIGCSGELHEEAEQRMEFILHTGIKNKILKTLITSHPYEEPAYDFIKLENAYKYTGSGVIGNIEPTAPKVLFARIKAIFNVPAIRYSKNNINKISRVAICGGSGASFLQSAIVQNADVFISGDFKYHDFTTFGNDIIIADIGHYESEQFTKDIFYNIIQENFPNFVSYYPDKEKNPINYL
ncbi:MAG: Nif3-like dinuclear metal center hexameric protein [Muribaculaceae bacterium]|nr:Nif3-like dinuclear metal center hexameric protein [Muribaculaceae bacterium]